MPVRAPSMLLISGLAVVLGACSLSGLSAGLVVAGLRRRRAGLSLHHCQPSERSRRRSQPGRHLRDFGTQEGRSLKGPSWLVCVKSQKFPLLPRYYAVFIQRDRIVDSRVSVLVDQCELQTYAPFDWIADRNSSAAARALSCADRRPRCGRCRPRRDSCRSAPRSAPAESCRGWRGDGRRRSGCRSTRSRAPP